mgnify:CR=1 FL=1
MPESTTRNKTRTVRVAIIEDDPYGDIYFTDEPVPPLRARKEDVLLLLESALDGVHALSPQLVQALEQYRRAYRAMPLPVLEESIAVMREIAGRLERTNAQLAAAQAKA